MAMRHAAEDALAARGTAMAPCHVGRNPGLVDEDQAVGLQEGLGGPPDDPRGSDIRPLLFGGMERLFFSVRPRLSRKRQIDEMATAMPCFARCAWSSSSVMSGCAATNSRTSASWPASANGFLPRFA